MISVKLRDFRGCERAEITCAPIALVAGRNAAGKSSIAQATAAVLSGQTLPLDMTKSEAGDLVLTGAGEAAVEIRSEDGISRVTWPSCVPAQDGDPPHATIWAVGIDSIGDLDEKGRAKILAEYLHSDPTREDLAHDLAAVELGDDKIIDAVWKLVEAQGWDPAHETRREMGANLKGQWRQVTGQNYGSKRARSWQPQGYSLDLEDATKVQLDAAVLDARTAHERAIAASAVSGAERTRLEQSAAEAEDLKDKLADAEIEETRLETELEKLRGERAGLPPAGAEVRMSCPDCGAALILRQVDLATRRLFRTKN